jgi:hypothetical protein
MLLLGMARHEREREREREIIAALKAKVPV